MKFNYDKFLCERSVCSGFTSLSRCGLIVFNDTHVCLQCNSRQLDNKSFCYFTFQHNKNIDYEYEVIPSPTNPLLLQPSKERALVENILHLDWIDEGLLIEALQTYLDQFYDEEKLYRVAAYFGLDKDTLNYWIKEAKEDYEV